MTTVGGGKYTYTLVQDWAKLPAGQSFGTVSAVATDSQDSEGIFYISERAENGTPPQISVLDGEGSVLARWPSRSAHGSWVDAHGDIYLALTAEQSVDKYIRQS